jgi:serine/threonine protein phosphatase 1
MIWTTAPVPAIPAGHRIYAIGDIHGRLDLMDQLLRMIVLDDQEREAVERRILIFLGDYVDRGAESRGVIDRLLTGLPEGFERICLKGNHEHIMLRALTEPLTVGMWIANGGGQTMMSYGVIRDDEAGVQIRPQQMSGALAEALPPEHLEFLQTLPISTIFGDYLFVHGGVRPGVALDAQDDEDCLFIREPFLSHRGAFGKVVVHGHTPVREPEVRSNRIGIDTGGFYTGRLTALRLDGESRGFLAT